MAPRLPTPQAVDTEAEATPVMTSAPQTDLKDSTPLVASAMSRAVPYNILSLDGGGARGAMEAVILDDVMKCLTLVTRGELQEDWVTEHFGNGGPRKGSGTREASGVVMRGDPEDPMIRRSKSLPMSRLSIKVSVRKKYLKLFSGRQVTSKTAQSSGGEEKWK